MSGPTSGTGTNKVMVLNLNDYSQTTIDLAPASYPTAIAFRGVFRFNLYLPLILR